METTASQSGFLYPIWIPLKHSRSVFSMIGLMHALSALILLCYSLTIPEWPLWIVLVLSGLWYWRIYNLNHFPLAAKAILLNSENEWLVVTEDDKQLVAKERSGSFVHPVLVVLLLRCQQRNMSFVFCNDNVQKDVLRRLRVRLRYPVNNPNHSDYDDFNLR